MAEKPVLDPLTSNHQLLDGWNLFFDVTSWLQNRFCVNGSDFWPAQRPDCKYLNARIDMRTGNMRIWADVRPDETSERRCTCGRYSLQRGMALITDDDAQDHFFDGEECGAICDAFVQSQPAMGQEGICGKCGASQGRHRASVEPSGCPQCGKLFCDHQGNDHH